MLLIVLNRNEATVRCRRAAGHPSIVDLLLMPRAVVPGILQISAGVKTTIVHLLK